MIKRAIPPAIAAWVAGSGITVRSPSMAPMRKAPPPVEARDPSSKPANRMVTVVKAPVAAPAIERMAESSGVLIESTTSPSMINAAPDGPAPVDRTKPDTPSMENMDPGSAAMVKKKCFASSGSTLSIHPPDDAAKGTPSNVVEKEPYVIDPAETSTAVIEMPSGAAMIWFGSSVEKSIEKFCPMAGMEKDRVAARRPKMIRWFMDVRIGIIWRDMHIPRGITGENMRKKENPHAHVNHPMRTKKNAPRKREASLFFRKRIDRAAKPLSTHAIMETTEHTPPAFLVDLLNARSPSGYEAEAQAVVDRFVEPSADEYRKDTMGNRIATVNPTGDPTLLLSGHMDELGLLISYVDDKGFLYFETVGGIDLQTISGRRVSILTSDGIVRGVTGRRAIHLLNEEERKQVPKRENLWIDIGAKSKDEALQRVRIGDVAVYDHTFELFHGSLGVARAFDNKSGCYVVMEATRRLAAMKDALAAKVVGVATAQEEIGCRGARTVATLVPAHFALAVDVGHATDHPECDNRRFGEFKLGGGPILTRGANVNPIVFDRLVAAAEEEGIPFQIEANARPTATDGRELQMGNGGVATGVLSIPLRYMHTPSEIVDLEDIENAVRLIVAFAKALPADARGDW